ncbi:MAG: cyclic pyranopterin monophosphate synthase MoaC, partial [Gammaproteobacteria bacterium]|nr:cyclic pyranopterin monophosphate synthase MoaC [Gammaproteobacteria bacterium]
MSELTHFDSRGAAHMVDVSSKQESHRVAVAAGRIRMQPRTLEHVERGENKKGDVLGVARLAGIMAAKKTAELIPLCHPLPLTRVNVDFEIQRQPAAVLCTVTAETVGRTGVEME